MPAGEAESKFTVRLADMQLAVNSVLQAVRDLEQASDALIVLPTHKLTEGGCMSTQRLPHQKPSDTGVRPH